MRLGMMLWSSPTGLGYQGRNYAKHLEPTKILLNDLSNYNQMPTNHDWYPDARIAKGIPTNEDMEWLTDDVDTILIVETPLNFQLYDIARRKGVKTIQIYNYEFLDFFENPLWPKPDLFAAPTSWGKPHVETLGVPIVDLPLPIDPTFCEPRNIVSCETFIHIVGLPAVHDRNGTLAFIQAANMLGNKFRYKIFYQTPKDRDRTLSFEPILEALRTARVPIEQIADTENNQDIYAQGDVLVLPRRYGGLCLPMLEALSAGMPVIMTDIQPNYDILPEQWLCRTRKTGYFWTRHNIDLYDAEILDLHNTMLRFAEPTYMEKQNVKARQIAQDLTWDHLKPYYDEVLNA